MEDPDMKKTKILGMLVLSSGLLLNTTSCAGNESAQTELTTTAEPLSSPAEAAKTIEKFFEATTSDEIAADLPDNADDETFSEALRYTDPTAGSDDVATAMADFALVKVLDPAAKLSIEVDASQIVVKERTATVPVAAISVKSGDKELANSAALAEEVNSLVFREGAWLIAFPSAPIASSSPTGHSSAPASSPSTSAK
ncbi:hypothetical protein LJ754_03150 [Arthrobacter sp. zg-Y40]|uniref:hypothetical protein n=1 Tax=Arthrobacter sp. zg-Y40 TaxID=2886939 RepID=UPI001D13B47C|nr:hypothetical protein [Arthrobacter sp. zg-Y40]MCC3278157.1 hypothetical protein [Arthrobacter sp. zg-Y40]